MGLLPYVSATVTIFLLYYIIPYYTSYSKLRSISGPFFARFSNLWLLIQARRGRRFLSVHNAHKKYGKFVRIQPNQVSIADEAAISQVYGHGNGFLKSEFYGAFKTLEDSIFTTRDRAIHSRKRKVVAHTYSTASVSKFEKYITDDIQTFVRQLDKLSLEFNGDYAEINCMHWFNLLAFDIVGNLAFGKSFDMLETGKDIAEVRITPNNPITYVPAVEILNKRSDVSATLGCLPALLPFAKYFPDPFYNRGLDAVEKLTGMAIARVAHRFNGHEDSNRVDILARLMNAKDENGDVLSRDEVTTEATVQIIAGSDTISNTCTAILYWILRTPHVLSKLQAELDSAIPDNVVIPPFEEIKDLPYLENVIKETLRIHSTSSIGLPRVVPPGPGVTICSRHFPGGTVISVPSFTIHHSPEIWGEDVEEFKPERWECLTPRQKLGFNVFSYGPRACIGRNLAMMEIKLIFATMIHRWDFELYTEKLETKEGFIRKPVKCLVGFKRRVKYE
ncbi:Benzoate 4-monooxygenase [Golovinomyces cichoracearum]|uniref:Benzoate 4-monooxygenase n=1 Tax=Golovinomyces cichoracearum TaxID=62708 RepID=A0A420IWA0_9PEZI|nr:Benzoate 4-monooxygenase [Golovinomyces cichoracearum]